MTISQKYIGHEVAVRRDSRWPILIALYSVAALTGTVQAIGKNALAAFLCSLLFATLASGWCVVDARKRGKPLIHVVQMIIFLTWPVAIPAYLISSRRLRGMVYALLHGVALYLTTLLFLTAALYLIYGSAAFTAAPP